jgi:hypothetical protein
MSDRHRFEQFRGAQGEIVPASALSTREVARQAGVDPARLSIWLATGRIHRPKMLVTGGRMIWLWTDDDIERIRLYQQTVRSNCRT